MKWVKKIYKLYMKGYRENCFPISEYGLFGSRKPSPPDTKE